MGLTPVSQLLLIEGGEPAKKQEELGPSTKMFQEKHRPVKQTEAPSPPFLKSGQGRAGLTSMPQALIREGGCSSLVCWWPLGRGHFYNGKNRSLVHALL